VAVWFLPVSVSSLADGLASFVFWQAGRWRGLASGTWGIRAWAGCCLAAGLVGLGFRGAGWRIGRLGMGFVGRSWFFRLAGLGFRAAVEGFEWLGASSWILGLGFVWGGFSVF